MNTPRTGYFGQFGGQFVPETLMKALHELEREFDSAWADPSFREEFAELLKTVAGRPSELYFCERLTNRLGGAQIYLKREDMNHTGAHKINNTLGQALLAKRMGKNRLIAETGAGQHGVATATAAAYFGMECDVFMGAEDCRRQALNVFRMELMGTNVISVETGQKTLKDALNEALRCWMSTVETTHYILGTVAGPHPFPEMVTKFQRVIGDEARAQMLDLAGRLPDVIVACVGGGSNASGIFKPFENDASVKLVGVEAGGRGMGLGDHAAPLCAGQPGVLHGSLSYALQNEDGQTADVHSVSAGLDYPGVGPEHSFWKETGRAEYTYATDADAIEALKLLSRVEGIIPALESSHAVAEAVKRAPLMGSDEILLVTLSGRGDKDCDEIKLILGQQAKE